MALEDFSQPLRWSRDTLAVTAPREILRNETYLVTRRTTQRQFLLLPNTTVKQVAGYCLALAQRDTQAELHAACFQSNHYHNALTDRKAELPRFSYILNKYLAKCLNAYYGRWENFWAGGVQTSYVRLADDADKIDKLAYAVANPVEAGLVSRSANWPGLLLYKPGLYTFERPKYFFSEDGLMPKSLQVEITPLPLQQVQRPREVMELVGKAVYERETAVRRRFRRERRKFMGIERLLRQSPFDSPKSRAPQRNLSPKVAARDKWQREEILGRSETFVEEHRDCRRRWIAGEQNVCFPAGTYKMRVEFGVRCADT